MTIPKEHFSRLRRLLQVEREEDRNQYQQKIRNRSITDRVSEGVCWYPVESRKSYVGIGDKWTIDLKRVSQFDQRHFFHAGSSASLFVQDGNRTLAANGIISRISNERMTLMLHRDEPPDWLDMGKMGVDLLFDESTYDEMERTLKRLEETKEGRISELIQTGLGLEEPRFNPDLPV